MAEKSKKEGYSKSRLPSFTKEEIQLIRGTNYWFPRGLNAALSNLTLLTQSIQVSINPRWGFFIQTPFLSSALPFIFHLIWLVTSASSDCNCKCSQIYVTNSVGNALWRVLETVLFHRLSQGSPNRLILLRTSIAFLGPLTRSSLYLAGSLSTILWSLLTRFLWFLRSEPLHDAHHPTAGRWRGCGSLPHPGY